MLGSSRSPQDAPAHTCETLPEPHAVPKNKLLPLHSSFELSPPSADSSSSVASIVLNPRLSVFRLFMAHVGAALALFLATTDATIVSTSLPTITSALGASESQYTWVGISYMLTQTAFQPLYGRISDLLGRKVVLYSSLVIFVLGSVLCGAARSMTWLILARALAGVGGGGIVSSVWVITAEIVEEQSRAKWSQALSVTWSCSAIAGPLLGGFFSNDGATFSWRWAFYLNVPVCLIAFLVLLISLRDVHTLPSKGASWRSLGRTFDFVGLFAFMTGTSCIVVGLTFATDIGWTSASTLSLIVGGLAVLACGASYELRTHRVALFPRDIFKNPTAVVILIVIFLHNFVFTAGTFYLSLYFQAVNGSSPLQAGIQMLPYSLGSSVASIPAAWIIGFWQRRTMDTSAQKYVTCTGLFLAAIGFGLLNILHEKSSLALQLVFPLIAGMGLGVVLHAPYQVFAKALKPHELAAGTGAFFLVRFTGATVGLSIAGAAFYGTLSHRWPADYHTNSSNASINWTSLGYIEPTVLRLEVLHSVATSLRVVWTVCAPCLGVAFVLSLFVQKLAIYMPSTVEKADQKEAVIGLPAGQESV